VLAFCSTLGETEKLQWGVMDVTPTVSSLDGHVPIKVLVIAKNSKTKHSFFFLRRNNKHAQTFKLPRCKIIKRWTQKCGRSRQTFQANTAMQIAVQHYSAPETININCIFKTAT
jgi:hypothetical protein